MERRNGSQQGIRDAASVLPFITTVLLLPPIILIFAAPGIVGGAPLILIYIFTVWAVAIVISAFIAWRLGEEKPVNPVQSPDENGKI
ncbi:MAG TPA: hypothetical protein VKA94_12820 [Hyphomicrobiales bacterium]|nr:hypothetical protein [Hyphomicrobiales bacterium]